MKNEYHILNGDSLRHQMEGVCNGEIIVARECLMDGSLDGEIDSTFFSTRAKYFQRLYEDYTLEDYFRDSVLEFEKIMHIPSGSTVNLWFEEDLYSQVNLWFVTYILDRYCTQLDIFLLMPTNPQPLGFAGLDASGLDMLYQQRKSLQELSPFVGLWNSFKENDTYTLKKIAHSLNQKYNHIAPVVKAHLNRNGIEQCKGPLAENIYTIIDELGTDSFIPVFRSFMKKYPIYGYGDLQFEQLLKQLLTKK